MCYYCDDDDDDDDHMAAHEYMFAAAAVLAPCSQNLKYEMTHMTHTTTAVSNDTGHLPSIMCHVTLGTEGQVHLWINLKMAL